MDSAEILTDSEAGAAPAVETCPRCGEAPAGTKAVSSRSLGIESVRRCVRCGTRTGNAGGKRSLVFTCVSCGLPFAADDLLPHVDYRCPPCRDGALPSDLPTAEVTRAVEVEIRGALSRTWVFVRSDRVSAYVEPLARRIASRVAPELPPPRVVLLEDDAIRTLALPSGLILISVGALTFLEDEAELAFVLAHEIAHAACGDAAVRLVRLGFRATQREARARHGDGWGDAAEDLVRLGYGRHRERDADARAVAAVVDLGYDTASVIRYLRRIEDGVLAGDSRLAELAVAHPTSPYRIRRIERALYGRISADGAAKVNREVFRRAIAPDLSRTLHRTVLETRDREAVLAPGTSPETPRRAVTRIAVATVVMLAAVAGAILLLVSVLR